MSINPEFPSFEYYQNDRVMGYDKKNPEQMNTTTSVAGGCHHAGIALCSSQCVKRIITICQLRKIISGYP